MEHYMAEFGQGFVQAAVLSENNAVKYKISAAGSCTKSTVRPYVRFQDKDLINPTILKPGLNAVVFDGSTREILEIKSYNFTKEPSAVNQAFQTYMESLTGNKLVILISEGKLNTCPGLANWFRVRNSNAWPEPWAVSAFDVAYTGFYITSMSIITAEHVLHNDGVTAEEIIPHLDVVWDYFSDIGATGTPKRIGVFDGEKHSASGEDQELLRLPTTNLNDPIADFNLQAGDVFYLKFQSMVDTGPSAAPGDYPNGTTRCSIRWFKDGTLMLSRNIDALTIVPGQTGEVSYLGKWQSFERYITVPDDVDSFTIYFFKTDNTLEDVGAVRNAVVVETTREDTPVLRSAEFGVNGIRLNTMIDGTVDELLILNDSKTDDRGQVRSVEFRELY